MEKSEKLDTTGFLTSAEVRKLLRISQPTLTRYIKNGCLSYYRLGRKYLFDGGTVLGEIRVGQRATQENEKL